MGGMKALLILALLSAPAARAGLWDAVKEKAKAAVKQSAETRDRKKIRSPKATAAVRGLEEDEDEGAAKDEPRDYESLQWLESLEVTDEEVDRFAKEGRLAS